MARVRQRNTLKFWVDVEVYDEDEFERYVLWVKENVASTDRHSPKWSPGRENDFSFGGLSYDDGPKKFRFGFRNEEDAMAFKLILNSHNTV